VTLSNHQKALYGLITVLSGITAHCLAQEANPAIVGPTLTCSGSANCPAPPIAIAAMGGPQIGLVQPGGMAFAIEGNTEVVKNQPYQAQAVTEMKQTLADGSHITQTTDAIVARDSDGRTVRIQKMSTIGPWKSAADSSQADGPTLTTIFDPVAMTHTDYTSDSNVAHVLPMPSLPARGEVRATAAGGVAMFSAAPGGDGTGPVTFSLQGHGKSPQPADAADATSESLGTKTIQGISVIGTRDTRTIPAGTIGNDEDLIITRETWYSPDLKLVIESTQNDPRFGETTYTLTNIQRSEPDPSMFQAPPGYTVDKVPVHVQMHQVN
jgi:hypothetical protein